MAEDKVENYTIVTPIPVGKREDFLKTLIEQGQELKGKRILASDFTRAMIFKMIENPTETIKFLGL
jgi:hypothetical protein